MSKNQRTNVLKISRMDTNYLKINHILNLHMRAQAITRTNQRSFDCCEGFIINKTNNLKIDGRCVGIGRL